MAHIDEEHIPTLVDIFYPEESTQNTITLLLDPPIYLIINSPQQLPPLNPSSSLFRWTPCAIKVLSQVTIVHMLKDPYLYQLLSLFLNTNLICSTSLCHRLKYCHILWMVLDLSNYIKQKPDLSPYYPNKYIHPIFPYSPIAHQYQHYH